MKNSYLANRRKFIKGSAMAGALSFAPGTIRAANKASNFLRVGVIGLSRGGLTSVVLRKPRVSRWPMFARRRKANCPWDQSLEGGACKGGC